jgi:hypothetical protein
MQEKQKEEWLQGRKPRERVGDIGVRQMLQGEQGGKQPL